MKNLLTLILLALLVINGWIDFVNSSRMLKRIENLEKEVAALKYAA